MNDENEMKSLDSLFNSELPLEVDAWSFSEPDSEGAESQRPVREVLTKHLPEFGWVDVTKDFQKSCNEMQPGELAIDSNFGLYEAMGAIEIMDLKMNMFLNKDNAKLEPSSLKQAIEMDVLKLNDLKDTEVIGIFDALVVCLVSWLDGNSLDQTLFSCLYLHAPLKIENKPLRVFCIAMHNLVVIIRNIVTLAAVNKEEDFQLFCNEAVLNAEKPEQAALPGLLKSTEDELMSECQKLSPEMKSIHIALLHRMRYMRYFYESFNHLGMLDTIERIGGLEDAVNNMQKKLNVVNELLPLLKESVDYGTQPLNDSKNPNPMGFSTRLYEKGQLITYPRQFQWRDRASSYQYLDELITRLKYVCKVMRCKDYYNALNFFIDFGCLTTVCAFSRCVLQVLFNVNIRLTHHGKNHIKQFLRHSIEAFNSPPVLNAKNPIAADVKVQHFVETFFRYCLSINIFNQFIRLCGYNRAGQRDRLAHLIEGFDMVQIAATRLDIQLNKLSNERAMEGNELHATALKHSTQFNTWVMYICFRAMYNYLMSGFELDLYATHEYHYIYWYSYEYLSSFLISALVRTDNIVIAQAEYADYQYRSSGRKKKMSKPKKIKKHQNQYSKDIIYYHAVLSLAGGMYKAMCALTKEERIRLPVPRFDNEELRFKRRFASFATLSNLPVVTYADFKMVRDRLMQQNVEDIYGMAAKHFDQARYALDTIQNPNQEIIDLLLISRTNFIVMNVLASGHQKEFKSQPEFDYSKNHHYPIIKLK